MQTIEISNTPNSLDHYNSISEVLKALSFNNSEIFLLRIHPGIYHEKIEILHNNLIIEGTSESPEDVVLSFDDFAFDLMPDGTKRGTFRSYSVLIDASNVTLRNLTIANTSGDENSVGQALALYADGDNLTFENCRFLSRQDTIFVGPLPPKEAIPGGFIGPKQFAPRINGHQYYKDCYICGNVDFIFGSGTAYFENCEIESLSHGPEHEVQGYVTAPSTPEGQPYGFVFKNCKFTSTECADATCYLGRPWRDYGRSVFLDCEFGSHIKAEGFHDWNKELARKESFFATYNCKQNGTAFRPTAPFHRTLSPQEAATHSKENVLSDSEVLL